MAVSDALLSTGSRGNRVGRAQLALNGRMLDGPRLKIDEIFGPLTDRRVRTFQKANGLEVDGVIGPETASRLTIHGSDSEEVKTSVRAILLSPPPDLGVLGRYDSEYKRIEADLFPIAAAPAIVIGAVVVIVFLAFCAAMIALSAQARNQKSADPLAREFQIRLQRLREIMAANRPSDLVARMVDEVAGGIEFTARWATELRRQCDEQHPLGPNRCKEQARRVAELIASLIQKAEIIREPGLRGFRYDDLLKGVLRNVRDLIKAMFDLGDCQKCPFLQL